MMDINNILLSPISIIKGVSPQKQKTFESEFSVRNLLDLISFYPYKYIDRSKIYNIRDINPEMPYIQLKGILRGFSQVGTGSKKRLSAVFSDATGTIELTWFRSISNIQRMYTAGAEYVIFGKPVFYNGSYSIVHPEISNSNRSQYIQGLSPVYVSQDKSKKGGLNNIYIRDIISTTIRNIYNNLDEFLPDWIRLHYKLMPYRDAIRAIHHPNNIEELENARRRLKFDEVFLIQMSMQSLKINRKNTFVSYKLSKIGDNFNSLYKDALPFDLTNAQKRVIKEIYADCNSSLQMNRLIQGDVGSGKTLVALFAMLIAIDNGYQATMMAPTEILARQHFETISSYLVKSNLKVAVLTGSTSKAERKIILDGLKNKSINILIGTHALIEDSVEFANLAMAIIDEQHRFGVQQRSKLWDKNMEKAPHILVMSATPIPRTLAMTLYGDLDVSVIDELPPGRKAIRTVHHYEDKAYQIYDFIKKEIGLGRQAYVVYPMIDESENADYRDLVTGLDVFREIFPHLNIDMVHGKMKAKEKDAVMNRFKNGEINILLSTTVIEVGVNVPNASVMLIESANRFGLSQLHQLRGRVGRGASQSYCILMTSRKLGEEAKRRMDIMVATNDGFEIAEEDMKIRGFGDIEGTRQSGLSVNLKIANLAKDTKLIQISRDLVSKIYDIDPNLDLDIHQSLKNRLSLLNSNRIDWSTIS